MSALGGLRQEDCHEFKSSLGHIANTQATHSKTLSENSNNKKQMK